MDARERYEASIEARRDLADHPERTTRHEQVIGVYLGAMAYQSTHGTPDGEKERSGRGPAEREPGAH